MRNHPPPESDVLWNRMYGEAKMRLLASYVFCVALENTRQNDYVSEKVFQALAAG